MWCQQLKSGRWQYFERYIDPLTMKRKTISLTLDGHRKTDIKAAQTSLALRVNRLQALPGLPSKVLSFGELCDAYIAHQKETKKASTAAGAVQKIGVLKGLIECSLPITKLNAPLVRRCLQSDVPTTFNERLKQFKAMMRWAFREEMISDISFLEKLSRESAPKKDEHLKFLESEEVALLLSRMAVGRWALLTRFLVLSGLRIGEAIALDDADVDMESRIIHVTKTFSNVTKEIQTTKTYSSTREIYIQDELLECVSEIRALKEIQVEMFGNPSEIFFPSIEGTRLHYDAYRKYFVENTEVILGRKLTPHCLRHTHVALLAENNIPLDAISRRLGHADSKITKEVYFHVTERMREKENEAIKNVSLLCECYVGEQ